MDFFPRFSSSLWNITGKNSFFCTFKNTAAEPLGQYKLGEDIGIEKRLEITNTVYVFIYYTCYLFVVAHVVVMLLF